MGTGYLLVVAWLQGVGEQKGWAFMDELHDNVCVYTHSGSESCNLVGAGESPMGLGFEYRAAGIYRPATMAAFFELFRRHGVALAIGEDRLPLGLPKWHPIQALGLTEAEWQGLDASRKAVLRGQAREVCPEGVAIFCIDTAADLSAVIEIIEQRMRAVRRD